MSPVKNRLFLNALDNFTRTIFAIRTKNDYDTYVIKGFFCFIEPNTCNLINNELVLCMGAGSISKWIREIKI